MLQKFIISKLGQLEMIEITAFQQDGACTLSLCSPSAIQTVPK